MGHQPTIKSISVSVFAQQVILLRSVSASGRFDPMFAGLRRLMASWGGAVLGGSIYGAWAAWANWGQGSEHALLIGASHWATSAVLTHSGTWTMGRLYASAAQGLSGAVRAFVGGLTLTYVSLFAVHAILSTGQVLLTLAPGLLPNILFCGGYALLLLRTSTPALQPR